MGNHVCGRMHGIRMWTLSLIIAFLLCVDGFSSSGGAQETAAASFPEVLRGCWVAWSKEYQNQEAVDIGRHAYEQGDGRCRVTRVNRHKNKINQWELSFSCNKGYEGARNYRSTELYSIQTIDQAKVLVRMGHMFDASQIVVYKLHRECVLEF
jgi:hypothetical protein